MKTLSEPTQAVAVASRGQLLDLALFESAAEAEGYTRAVREWARESHVMVQIWRQSVASGASKVKVA